ncbi:MAG: hypothetical protein ACKO5K_02895 [Armatimonadota bacterium]
MSIQNGDFESFAAQRDVWTTLVHEGGWPESVHDACAVYAPIVRRFRGIADGSESSQRLWLTIQEESPAWLRLQLVRLFRRVVCDAVPGEMAADRGLRWRVLGEYGKRFRPIEAVQRVLRDRPDPDEALCALLWENRLRSRAGEGLTERALGRLVERFAGAMVAGPDAAGDGIRLRHVFPWLGATEATADFLVRDRARIAAIGWIRHERGECNRWSDRLEEGLVNLVDLAARRPVELPPAIVIVDGAGMLDQERWVAWGRFERRSPLPTVVSTLRLMDRRVEGVRYGIGEPAIPLRRAA